MCLYKVHVLHTKMLLPKPARFLISSYRHGYVQSVVCMLLLKACLCSYTAQLEPEAKEELCAALYALFRLVGMCYRTALFISKIDG